MFEKNDKSLHVYYVLIHIAFMLLIIASIVIGSVTIALSNVLYGVEILVGGIIFAIIEYIVARAIFGLFVDIKLIRNKLYGTDNGDLEKYYKQAEYEYIDLGLQQPSQSKSAANGEDRKYKLLSQLKDLRDHWIISEEEFIEKKRAILNEGSVAEKIPMDDDEIKHVFCDKCGAENAEGVKFCGNCGNKIVKL